jgi:hypothetical protein
MVVVQECDEEGVETWQGAPTAHDGIQILLRAGMWHVTGCPGVVVVQECDEEGVDAAVGAYCA